MKLIKTGIKLAVLAIVANGTWNVYVAYSAFYKFRDSVTVAAQNRGQKSDDQLHDDVLNLAAENDIPVTPDGVVVTHAGIATKVKAAYTRDVDLLPGRKYPWPFSFEVNTFTLKPGDNLQK